MKQLTIRDSVPEDAIGLASCLQENNTEDDIPTTMFGDTQRSFELGLFLSKISKTVEDQDGNIVGGFGVVPDKIHQDVGMMWSAFSPDVETDSDQFESVSRGWLELLYEDHPILWTLCPARNKTHIAWLVKLGFDQYRRLTLAEDYLEFIRPKETGNVH